VSHKVTLTNYCLLLVGSYSGGFDRTISFQSVRRDRSNVNPLPTQEYERPKRTVKQFASCIVLGSVSGAMTPGAAHRLLRLLEPEIKTHLFISLLSSSTTMWNSASDSAEQTSILRYIHHARHCIITCSTPLAVRYAHSDCGIIAERYKSSHNRMKPDNSASVFADRFIAGFSTCQFSTRSKHGLPGRGLRAFASLIRRTNALEPNQDCVRVRFTGYRWTQSPWFIRARLWSPWDWQTPLTHHHRQVFASSMRGLFGY